MKIKSKLWLIYGLIALVLIAIAAVIILVTSVNAATFSDPNSNFKGDAVYGPNNQTINMIESSSSDGSLFPWPSWVTWVSILVIGFFVIRRFIINVTWDDV